MAEQIDPDAETTEGAETSKPFGEHVKDAAHDLKEDAKGVVRRDEDDEDEGGGTSDEDGTSDDGEGGEDEA